MLVAALLLLTPTVLAPELGPEPDAQHMSPAEIRASNAGRDRRHPYYIRCKHEPLPGSLLRQMRSCRTNHQWELAFQQGNQAARDIMDDARQHSTGRTN